MDERTKNMKTEKSYQPKNQQNKYNSNKHSLIITPFNFHANFGQLT